MTWQKIHCKLMAEKYDFAELTLQIDEEQDSHIMGPTLV